MQRTEASTQTENEGPQPVSIGPVKYLPFPWIEETSNHPSDGLYDLDPVRDVYTAWLTCLPDEKKKPRAATKVEIGIQVKLAVDGTEEEGEVDAPRKDSKFQTFGHRFTDSRGLHESNRVSPWEQEHHESHYGENPRLPAKLQEILPANHPYPFPTQSLKAAGTKRVPVKFFTPTYNLPSRSRADHLLAVLKNEKAAAGNAHRGRQHMKNVTAPEEDLAQNADSSPEDEDLRDCFAQIPRDIIKSLRKALDRELDPDAMSRFIHRTYSKVNQSFDNLQNFESYVCKFVNIHNRCGSTCVHLHRFFERISYNPELKRATYNGSMEIRQTAKSLTRFPTQYP
jgi:hypothetical protein